MVITHPSTNQSQHCLTLVISRELVCQHGYGVAPKVDNLNLLTSFLTLFREFAGKNDTHHMEICAIPICVPLVCFFSPVSCGGGRGEVQERISFRNVVPLTQAEGKLATNHLTESTLQFRLVTRLKSIPHIYKITYKNLHTPTLYYSYCT